MRIVVTGAGGMLGRDVLRACDHAGVDCVGLPRAELDVTDPQACVETIGAHRPDAVINCAAWTDVDGAEEHEPAALALNGGGAGNLARACALAGAHLVQVSTDYVFDGTATRPYVESDPVAPLGAYGRTKLEGERRVADELPSAAIARSAWLFGTAGRNFVDTMLRLAADRGEVTVVDDQVGCPTYTGHLAPALLEIAARGTTGVLHVAGGGRCSWFDLAMATFEETGLACRVVPQSTAALGRPAPRPAFSALAGTRPDAPVLPPWREGLRAHLARVEVVA
jgi:dTDP-4-dehydrorhamnose reductase